MFFYQVMIYEQGKLVPNFKITHVLSVGKYILITFQNLWNLTYADLS